VKQYSIEVSKNEELPVTEVHTLIIGSGAAGLNAAVQLHREGITDILIVTEGLGMGTSVNTGSDKQTYYKTAMCGSDQDSPMSMALNYFSSGSMHGDLALVEASLSSRAFLNLVNLGVKFPTDAYGQFVGYKTDHDSARRGTSTGPYTSRDMCHSLIAEVKRREIPVLEKMDVVSLLTTDDKSGRRILGALALDSAGSLAGFAAGNVVFAVGGPGGLYETSVYPAVHTGGIGLALGAGAAAQGLPESQYGLASVKFRWNVSGSYMQVVPKFISTGADGESGAVEFLREYFTGSGESSGESSGAPGAPGGISRLHSLVFLKGYQWPFDVKKIPFGSSLIDILVYVETVVKGRRVFLDFRENPGDFKIGKLDGEARDYLEKSAALQASPIARLEHMNPGAVSLYKDHNIDLRKEMLEIAVCAQHNNGGLAGNHWWESVNIRGLFPLGEVNGSHGVARPGGSALNAGQVGGFRLAEYIARGSASAGKFFPGDTEVFISAARSGALDIFSFLDRCRRGGDTIPDWRTVRKELQNRMSRYGALIRSITGLEKAVDEARKQIGEFEEYGCRVSSPREAVHALKNRQLCLAHRVYLEALLYQLESGVGSRGSAMVQDASGIHIHPGLDKKEWSFASEDKSFRGKVLETVLEDGRVKNCWVERRSIPESNLWFETAWMEFSQGKIYH